MARPLLCVAAAESALVLATMAEVEPLDPAEVEFVDPYTYDEEQPYLMLISTSVNTLCFPCEEDYSIADCKNILAFKYPEKLPLGSFELVATHRVRADDETLADIFDGVSEPLYKPNCNLQIAVWPKEWDAATGSYEDVDLSYKEYGADMTKEFKKKGWLNAEGKLRDDLPELQQARAARDAALA